MPSNDSVIATLNAAVEKTPEDVDLRLHLAALLLDDGRAAEALEHFSQVLAAQPAHFDALRGAHEAAVAAGDQPRADGYATLLERLGESPTETETDEDQEPERIRAGGPPTLRVVGGVGDDAEVESDDDRSRITLKDVAGLEAVKRRIDLAFLGPLRNPAMAKAYGKKLRGGLLLYGPPGCGKTHIARALAGELRADFMSIGLSDVLNMYLGESEQRLHALFEQARNNAPTVIFMDELDALGRKRSELKSWGIREVVNQLLQELDGMHTTDDAVFVLAATNLPWDIDVALKRPGRFDRAIFVEPPDDPARQHIFALNLEERPTEGVDLTRLAKKTKGYSGADIAFICETATEKTLERAMQSGKMEPVSGKELERAIREVRPSIAAWFETARNYALFANASGEFNDLAEYLEAHRL